jgi:hypothetical protein
VLLEFGWIFAAEQYIFPLLNLDLEMGCCFQYTSLGRLQAAYFTAITGQRLEKSVDGNGTTNTEKQNGDSEGTKYLGAQGLLV